MRWHVDMFDRRLSEAHVDALTNWLQLEEVDEGTPPGLVFLRRYARQVCGRALQTGEVSDLDLAYRAILRGGAWIGDRQGASDWLYLTFLTYCARALGLDAGQFLTARAELLEVDVARNLHKVTRRTLVAVEPMDHNLDKYVPVRLGDAVDLLIRWTPEANQRAKGSALRRDFMAAKAVERYRRQGADDEAEELLSGVGQLDLPWLAPDVDPFAPDDDHGDDQPPAALIRARASTAAIDHDRQALADALAAAARFEPSLLGLAFRAADHVLGSEAEPWLLEKSTAFDDQARAAVEWWAFKPDRFTDLAGHVETGLADGPKFTVAYELS